MLFRSPAMPLVPPEVHDFMLLELERYIAGAEGETADAGELRAELPTVRRELEAVLPDVEPDKELALMAAHHVMRRITDDITGALTEASTNANQDKATRERHRLYGTVLLTGIRAIHWLEMKPVVPATKGDDVMLSSMLAIIGLNVVERHEGILYAKRAARRLIRG